MNTSNRARRIGHNVLSLFGSEAASRVCTLLTIWYMNHHWAGVATYGQYATAVNWITILIAFSDLGFNVLMIREVAHRRETAHYYLRNVMGMKLLFSGLFVVFLCSVGWVLHYEPVLRTAMMVISVRLFFEAVTAAYTYMLQAHEMMVYNALVTMFSSFARMIGVVLVIHFGGQVVAVCGIWALESALTMLLLLFIGFRNGWKPDFSLFRWNEGLSVLAAGVPLAAFGTFQMLYNRVDSVILKSLAGNEAVAYYDIASKVLLVSVLPSNLFSVAVLPALSAAQDHIEDFAKLAGRALKALAMMGFPIAVGGFCLSKVILTFLFGQKYEASGAVFSLMAFYIAFYYLMRIPVNILAVKSSIKLVYLYSGMFLVNLTLNFLFIPRWGYMGGAYAIMVCGMVEFGSGLWLIRDRIKDILIPRLLKELGLCMVAAWVMGGLILFDPRIYWLAVGPFVYLVALILLGALTEDDRNNILSVLKLRKAR